MNRNLKTIPPEDNEAGTTWEALDSRVSTAVHEIQVALEEALVATRDLTGWVEHLRALSAFMRQVESGLVEVRNQFSEAPQGFRPVAVPSLVPKAEEPWPLERDRAESETGEGPPAAVAEAGEPAEPAEGEPPDKAPSAAEGVGGVCLEIESSEANIDLMVVERVLRETPGVADVDLRDYAGKRATVRVTLTEGESSEETGDRERLAADVQERLAKLARGGNLSVSVAE